jgi:hypothetical protein
MEENFDKTIETIETILDITEDVENDLEDGKLSFTEGAGLVLKHGVKAVKAIGSIKEIGQELADIDSDEASEATELIVDHFGGSEAAKAALVKITSGSALVYEGTKELIALRK